MAGLGFNLNDVPNGGNEGGVFMPVTGEHCARVESIERKESKSNPGCYFANIRFDITSPMFEKRVMWLCLNLWGKPGAKYTQIAQEQFKKLCKACGLKPEEVTDTDQVAGKMLNIVCKLNENGEGEVKYFNAYDPERAGKKLDPKAKEIYEAAKAAADASGEGGSSKPPSDDDVPF